MGYRGMQTSSHLVKSLLLFCFSSILNNGSSLGNATCFSSSSPTPSYRLLTVQLHPLLWKRAGNVTCHSLQQKCNPSGTRWLQTEVAGQHKEQRERAQVMHTGSCGDVWTGHSAHFTADKHCSDANMQQEWKPQDLSKSLLNYTWADFCWSM